MCAKEVNVDLGAETVKGTERALPRTQTRDCITRFASPKTLVSLLSHFFSAE